MSMPTATVTVLLLVLLLDYVY